MARIIPKGRPRRDRERQPIEMVKHFDRIELRNPGSGETVTLPKDASHAEIAKARKQLRPAEDSIYDQNAKTVVERMYGTQTEPANDPEPYVPFSPGRLRDKALTAHAQWAARRDAAKARERETTDQRRLVEGIREAIKAEREAERATEAPQAPPADDPWGWEAVLARAEAAAQQPEAGGSGDAD